MPPNNPPSDDPEVLASQVRQARADLNKLTIQGETIINEAQKKVDGLEKRAKWLRDNIAELEKQELAATERVAEATHNAERIEQEVSDKLTALRRKEQELDNRERIIKNKERQHSAQLRRNLM